jgi:hypothetical protein
MKYVVTAISRLTGERETISSPLPKEQARQLMERQKRRNHSHSVWSRLELWPAAGEGWLFSDSKNLNERSV